MLIDKLVGDDARAIFWTMLNAMNARFICLLLLSLCLAGCSNGVGSEDTVSDAPARQLPQEDDTSAENPVTEPETVDTFTPAPTFEFTIAVDNNRRAINEGDSKGTTFALSVESVDAHPIDVKVRAESASDNSGMSVELATQQLDADNSGTTVTFKLPVAMQPRLEHERRFNVIAESGDEVRIVELILDVKPIEVPDVYLLIGQSNMIGRSGDNAKDSSAGGSDETHPRIRQLNVTRNDPTLYDVFSDFSSADNAAFKPRYIRAEDPLHEPLKSGRDTKSGTTVGPGLSFAKAALKRTTQDIYLVPGAWSASGFCRSDSADANLAWMPQSTSDSSLGGTGLLERALVRLRITLRDTDGIFRGILWQQGEADSESQACAESYAQNLQMMVERIRIEARVDRRGEQARGSQAPIPFIVSTQSRGRDKRGDYSLWSDAKQQVDAVHRDISSLVPFADWINNDDLLPPAYPCGSTGCIHFGPEASREIGQRFFDALQRVWTSADK